jgi:hypothetical protein
MISQKTNNFKNSHKGNIFFIKVAESVRLLHKGKDNIQTNWKNYANSFPKAIYILNG